MSKLLEALTSFYWLFLPETIFGTFRRVRRRGRGSLLGDAFRSVVGTNTHVFFVPIAGRWDGRSIHRLLRRYNIDMWGWGFHNSQLFFHVHRADADRAYAIMHAAGVDLQ